MKIDIKDLCRGRWTNILINIGINKKHFNGKHQRCIFGHGKDCSRWDIQKEFYFCSRCGHKSPVDVAMQYLGLSFKETANRIRELNVNNIKPMQHVNNELELRKNKERLKRIYARLKRITSDSPAMLYFKKRGINVIPEQNCFYNPVVPYFDNGEKTGLFPAIVSRFCDAEGETSTYHITYIDKEGNKLDCSSPKKMLPVIKPMVGGAIRLFSTEGTLLAITEGIETAMAVHEETGYPVWASGSAYLMANLKLPKKINEIIIFADNDRSFTGQKAAYELANRLVTQENRKVKVVNLQYDDKEIVEIVDEGMDKDYLDYLNDKLIKDKAVL